MGVHQLASLLSLTKGACSAQLSLAWSLSTLLVVTFEVLYKVLGGFLYIFQLSVLLITIIILTFL